MRKSPTLSIEIICTECGSISNFQRSTSKKAKKFDKVCSYCFNCRKETEQYILMDKDLAYNYLIERIELNNSQQIVLNLLKKYHYNNKIKTLEKK